MDETRIALGVCTNSIVLASSSKRKAYVKTPENREWVSIIEAVSAAGQKLRCLVVFKGKSLQTTWFPSESIPDWLYTTSENGWTSNLIGLEWLKRIFIPDTATQSDRYRMLILDGHGSHVDIDFMWECKKNKIAALYLPPHSSHVLQPLDLAPFSVVKSKYRDQIRSLSALDDAAPVKKERFISSYKLARDEGLSERVIRAGWRATGLSPYNPELVISSSQVSARPKTPPLAIQPDYPSDSIFRTPQRPQDLYHVQQLLQRSEKLSRSTQRVLGKAGKAIAIANTRSAQLQAANIRLQYQLDSIKNTRSRKRVQVDPNERFNNAEAIRDTIDRAAASAAQNSAQTSEKAAAEAAHRAAASTLQSMCNEWQT
jgi:hypothetical protein